MKPTGSTPSVFTLVIDKGVPLRRRTRRGQYNELVKLMQNMEEDESVWLPIPSNQTMSNLGRRAFGDGNYRCRPEVQKKIPGSRLWRKTKWRGKCST